MLVGMIKRINWMKLMTTLFELLFEITVQNREIARYRIPNISRKSSSS